jgi:flagellar biosynthesis anti-sigma factor FlgM
VKIKPSDYSNIINKYSSDKTSQTKNTENNTEAIDKNQQKDKGNSEYKVEISEDYKVHKKAMEELKSLDEKERAEKLQSLKEQIKQGKYEIDPNAIAKSITDKLI